MRMQKEQFDLLMTEFYDPSNHEPLSRISVFLSTIQRECDEGVTTACYVMKGIWTPCADVIPGHEHFDDTYGWIITLHWMHSTELVALLENYLLTKEEALNRPYGVLNFESMEVQSPVECLLSLSECSLGVFSILYATNGHKVSFKVERGLGVSLLSGKNYFRLRRFRLIRV